MVIVESERLRLRRVSESDDAALMHIFGDKEVMCYGDGVKSLAWVQDWIQRTSHSYKTRNYGKWIVVDKGSSAILGYCGLAYADDVCGRPEVALGYRLAREHWGRGFASEAVVATVDYAFGRLGIKRLVATIDPGNVASIRVAQKAGMVYEAEVMYEGYTHPDHVYVIENRGRA